jgi:hypothetical protein
MDTSKQQTLPSILLRCISGSSDTNRLSRKSEGSPEVTENQVRTVEDRLEEKTIVLESEWSET